MFSVNELIMQHLHVLQEPQDFHHNVGAGELFVFRFDGHITRIRCIGKQWEAAQYANASMCLRERPGPEPYVNYDTLAEAIAANY